ncbi:MAG: phoH [Gammaproteobacteria bacterium]|nr:phoH [Gammaproteobacteria bacterium]
MNLCGQCDEHLRQIESHLHVEVTNRGNIFQITGDREAVNFAAEVLTRLYTQTQYTPVLSAEQVHLFLKDLDNKKHYPAYDKTMAAKTLTTPRITVKPRGLNQANYVQQMTEHDLTFGIGPAGTGKTYLAVACAVNALVSNQVNRIILTRPAVESGERLGFLPGDFSQKVDPYLRPLYDALYEMLGLEQVLKYTENNRIEIAPLAYMRGRTLNDAFIILDEAQNTTKEQMKMFLTRIGFGAKVVVTGDVTQVDLPPNQESGLRNAIDILKGVADIQFTFFESQDIVRHALVKAVVEAYAHYEKKKRETNNNTLTKSRGNL